MKSEEKIARDPTFTLVVPTSLSPNSVFFDTTLSISLLASLRLFLLSMVFSRIFTAILC